MSLHLSKCHIVGNHMSQLKYGDNDQTSGAQLIRKKIPTGVNGNQSLESAVRRVTDFATRPGKIVMI